MKRFVFLLLTGFALHAQTDYPKDYFRSPLDIPLSLSGSFGELRTNHFHSGLDLKTKQREGLNVYAVADGYISRIKISPYGYGKAIYIDHPNGYTSVYGHLLQGYGAIETYIKNLQYSKQSFEVEVFPKPGELPVRKGDVIALSGNTGGSAGPHLHFEFRDTKTERIINPMHFGFDIKVPDTKKPVVTTLLAYPIGEFSSVNRSQRPLALNMALQADGTYIADKIEASGKVGFGISSYDLFDFNYNKNGVYSVQSYCNGNPCFGYTFDSFAFDEGRYINALIDYPRFKRTGMRIQKLFRNSAYPLSLIKTNAENGLVTVLPNTTRSYKIEVSDFRNNKVVIDVPIAHSPEPPTDLPEPVKTTPYLLKVSNDNSYRKGNVSVFVPANTFYEDFYLNFDVADSVLTLHDDSVPVHSNFSVTFEDKDIPAAVREKTFIASLDGKKLTYNATKRTDSTFTAYTRNLGKFVLARDTVAPRISPVNIKQGAWLSKQSTLVLTISDNLSGIKEYSGWLNGKWILFEFDYKNRRIVHQFQDGIFADGRNDLKVVVSDNMGNSSIFETHFFRKK